MILTFENMPYVHFNEPIVISFLQGNIVQFKYESEDWVDYDPKISSEHGNPFGPWRYACSMYEWRVKPNTIEVECDREVKTVVKVKVEIPVPFKGELKYMQEYHRVYMHYGRWILDNDYTNVDKEQGKIHVKGGYVYLDKETAEKAYKILTGEQSND